ncbi:MAG TPA: hypothetical protein VGG64_09975 [Pirellulales bacterium]|jgi:hypothetical protein
MADFNPQADDQKLLAQVLEYYHRRLKDSPEALDYLRGRGITNGEAIDQFRIGYADRTLGLKLPSKQLKAGKLIRAKLEALGLFRSSGHEHFSGSLVFPITAADGSGRVLDIYGRKIGARLRAGTPLHTYLSDQRHGVWNIQAFRAGSEVIVCPSLFDALTFWNAGYRNVTCTLGADALTDDHLAAFAEFGIKRVLVIAETITDKLLAAGIDVHQIKLPAGIDANAYAMQFDDPAGALGALIRRAEWFGKGQPPPVPLPAIEPQDTEDDIQPADDPEPPASILTASPLPATPEDIEADQHGDEVVMHLGHRRYRVRGLAKNLSFDQLKVNVLASTESGMFVDSFDLYSARHRRQFIAQSAVELAVEEQTIKKDLGRVLLKLEELQDDQITRLTEVKETVPSMTDDEKQAALALLRDPQLLDRIVADFDLIGETTNKLVGYLAAVSRKLDQPLAIVIQSSSAAGKTSLMEAVLAFVPPEEQVKYSAMTGQALFYMGETNLRHKILAIVEEEGAQQASYALKLLQSEGELMIASTGKDAATGRLVTQEYRVEGPVMIFLTTTAIKIDEELLNRCVVLSVDEDRQQTKAIHELQRRRQTLAGLLSAQERQQTLALHRNAQRLLRPLLVANPYAEALTFLDDKTRTRRDHVKYLTLIRAIALLHQHQRPVQTIVHDDRQVEYIEVTLDDIAIANRLASEVLGRSVDELPPQTRRLLGLIDDLLLAACERQGIDRTDYRFSRRDIREATGWGHTQLKVHLKRLEELEYLLIHRGGRGQSFAYELLFDPPPDAGKRFLARLIDVDHLRRYDADRAGVNGEKSGRGRPQVGAKSGRGRTSKIAATADGEKAQQPSASKVIQNAHLDQEISATS